MTPMRTISRGDLAYFRARARSGLHQVLLREFAESGLSLSQLAERTGISRDEVSRTIGHPTNMDINTASQMLYAICGKFLSFDAVSPPASISELFS